MYRRSFLRAVAALGLPVLAGCGGANGGGGEASPAILDFTSDKTDYGVGDSALLTARFSGSGSIEPGNLPVASGVPVRVGPLLAPVRYRLVLSQGGRDLLSRDLALRVAYRNVFSPVPMGFARAGHVALPDQAGRILVLGGIAGGGALPAEVFAFDPARGAFSPSGQLLTGRTGHSATLLADGTVLIVGGSRSLSGSPVAERFDPRTGVSRPTHAQPAATRAQHSATLLGDGQVLLAGGSTPAAQAAGDTVELFDPHTESFTRWPARLASARFGHHAIPVGANALLLYGGVTPLDGAARPELLDLRARTSAVLDMPSHDAGARLHAALAAVGGDSYVIGGESFQDGQALATVAAISTAAPALRPAASLRVPRTMAAAAPLADGSVLVIGGLGVLESAPLARTEILAPAGAAPREGAGMAFGRSGHSATTLANGRVLVVGGVGEAGAMSTFAELYG